MKNLNEQINNITVPMSQVPEEIKQQWIQEYYEPSYREPFGNDNYDVPYVDYVQEEEPDDLDSLICPEYGGICPYLEDCNNCPKHEEYNDFLDRQFP